MACFATAIIAYFLGSIPTGFLVGKARGIDVRKVGSGNIGATNAFRVLGRTAGVIVLLVDALKGLLAVSVVPVFVHHFLSPAANWDEPTWEYQEIIAGVLAILGHNYTCWLGFKGGKGIATSAGVLAALIPYTFLIGLGTWAIVCAATRYVSVASIAAALVLPLATWLTGKSFRLIAVAAILTLLAIYKHKANIERLMNGTEHKIGRKNPPSAGTAIT